MTSPDKIDLAKIKRGDAVTVRLEWAGDANTKLWVKPFGAHDSEAVHIAPGDIVSHTPKALAVGDRVRLRNFGDLRDLLAVSGRFAWVRSDDGNCLTYLLSDLERAS